MTNHRTAEEAKQECVRQMGAPLGEFYSALWQEIVSLNQKWAEYNALFGTSPERVDLLNKAAPRFFRVIQDTLWEDTLIHIARLTDSPGSAGRPNFSVKRLPDLVSHSQRPELADHVANAVAACEFARDWRNRRIAHRDLELTLGTSVTPLVSASRLQVKAAISTLEKIANHLSQTYLESTTFFEVTSPDAVGC